MYGGDFYVWLIVAEIGSTKQIGEAKLRSFLKLDKSLREHIQRVIRFRTCDVVKTFVKERQYLARFVAEI
jgi:hypothetical protein